MKLPELDLVSNSSTHRSPYHHHRVDRHSHTQFVANVIMKSMPNVVFDPVKLNEDAMKETYRDPRRSIAIKTPSRPKKNGKKSFKQYVQTQLKRSEDRSASPQKKLENRLDNKKENKHPTAVSQEFQITRRNSSIITRCSTGSNLIPKRTASNKETPPTTSSNRIQDGNTSTTVLDFPQYSYKTWTSDEFLEDQTSRTLKWKNYGPCTIKVNPDQYEQHLTHPINVMLRDYNSFVKLVLKQMSRSDKTPSQIEAQKALKLAKRLDLAHLISKEKHLEGDYLRRKGQVNLIREQLVTLMCKVMQHENRLDEHFEWSGADVFDKQVNKDCLQTLVQERGKSTQISMLLPPPKKQVSVRGIVSGAETIEPQQKGMYKFFVSKGNNRLSLCRLMNGRHWWQESNRLEMEKVNFMWTQTGRKAIVSTFKSLLQEKRSAPKTGYAHMSHLACPTKLYNKLEDNYHLSNKKALFLNMRNYYESLNEDPFDYIPMTFHVKTGLQDPEFIRFKSYYWDQKHENDKKTELGQKVKRDNIWIIKPGEKTNQGAGIDVAEEYEEIEALISEGTEDKNRTCIIQKYIYNPLLVGGRKFDIRTYAMLSTVNGNLKGFVYEEGYLRTSCARYSLKDLSNRTVHLTNDAVQKQSENYGLFESGNKIGYDGFQAYLDKTFPRKNVCFDRDILPQIKKITTDCFRAVWGKIDPKKRTNMFELYGLDFMLDEDFKVYLIEVNTNPALNFSDSPLLARLIPTLLDNTFQLVVDPLFPPPPNFTQTSKKVAQELCPENKFELVFDEKIDGPGLAEILKERGNVIVEIEEDESSSSDDDQE